MRFVEMNMLRTENNKKLLLDFKQFQRKDGKITYSRIKSKKIFEQAS